MKKRKKDKHVQKDSKETIGGNNHQRFSLKHALEPRILFDATAGIAQHVVEHLAGASATAAHTGPKDAFHGEHLGEAHKDATHVTEGLRPVQLTEFEAFSRDLSHATDHNKSQEGKGAELGQPRAIHDSGDHSSQAAQFLIFVDHSSKNEMKHLQDRVLNLHSNVKLIFLDPNKDGFAQVTDTLGQYQNLSGIYLITHGNGSDAKSALNLSEQSVESHSAEIASWHASLTSNANVYIYGDHGRTGTNVLGELSSLVGATVRASENIFSNPLFKEASVAMPELPGHRQDTDSSSHDHDEGGITAAADSSARILNPSYQKEHPWDHSHKDGARDFSRVVTSRDASAVHIRNMTDVATIPEGEAPSTVILRATDQGANNLYSLSGADAHLFTVDSSGGLRLIQAPDYTQKDIYHVNIDTYNNGSKIDTEAVIVNITDIPPMFLSPAISYVLDGTAANSVVYTATAVDLGGDPVSYVLSGPDANAFTINSTTGALSLKSAANLQGKSAYNINVQASDASGLAGSQNVILTVTSTPTPNPANLVLPSPGTPLPTDPDAYVPVNYSTSSVVVNYPDLVRGAGDTYALTPTVSDSTSYTNFTVDSNGNVFFITSPTGSQAQYQFQVEILNGRGMLKSSEIVNVYVESSQPFTAVENVSLGLSESTYFNNSSTSNVVSYSLTGGNLPNNFSINSSTGLISGTPMESQEGQTYTFQVTALDGTNAVALFGNFNLTVNTEAPITSVISAQAVTENSFYSLDTSTHFRDLFASAESDFVYSLSGAPAWLSITPSTGLIFGTPGGSDVTSSPIVVTVTASDGTAQSSINFNLSVNDETITNFGSTDSTHPVVIANAVEGTAYSRNLSAYITDADNDLTYTAIGLPAGFTMDTHGNISGTPTGAQVGQTYLIKMTATGEVASSSSFSYFSFTVNDEPITNTAGVDAAHAVALTNAIENANYSTNVNAFINDSDHDLTYAVTGLPAGFAMDPLGNITGRPTEAQTGHTYVIKVTGTGEATSSIGYLSITVNEENPVTSAIADLRATENSAFSLNTSTHFTDTSTGLPEADYVYSLSANAPAWLTINSSTGVISGTPREADVTNTPVALIVTASDGTAQSSITFNLTSVLEENPVTTAIAAQTATENSAFSLNASTHFSDSFTHATEGDFVYSLSANAPAWLTINSSTGVISGTPRDSDVTTTPVALTVTATDGTALSSITFNLTAVNEESPVTTAIAAQTATENSAFSLDTSTHFSDSFTNATEGDFVYSLTGAPGWLTINSSTGVISGTPRDVNVTNTPAALRVTATDGTVSSSITFNLTAVLEENPVTTAIADQTATENAAFSLNASTHFKDSFTNATEADFVYSLSGAPAWMTINAGTGVISGTPRDSDVTSTPVALTVTATDGANLASITFNLASVNEQNPVTTAIVAQTATENSAFSLDASTHFKDSFTNATEGDFVYSLSANAPAWLTINSSTGVISGTPRDSDVTTTPVALTVTATDGSALSSITFNLTAVNEELPVTTAIAAQTATENSAFSLDTSTHFSDSFTNATEGDFVYSLTGAPAWLSINSSTGVISGTPRDANVTNTPAALRVTATDGTVSSSITFNLTAVLEENPVTTAIVDQTATENAAFSLNSSTHFKDSFTNATEADFVYSLSANAPAWLTINSGTGVISGTPRDSDVTSTPAALTVTATDGTNLASITFNLAAVNEQNPVTTAIAAQTATENSAFSLNASTHFSDSFTNATEGDFVYSLSANAPAWLTINSSTGVISGTPRDSDVTTTPVALTVTATDGSALSSITFNLTAVNEELPVTTAIAAQTATENSAFSLDTSTHFSDSFTNATEGDFVYSLTGAPAWLSINSSTGVISGTPRDANVTNTPAALRVTATDGTVSSSITFNLTAVLEENPVTTAIVDQTATENAAFSLNASTHFKDSFTNATEADFVYSLSGAPAWMTINAGTGVISGTPRDSDVTSTPAALTVTATDGSGQSSITFNLAAVNEQNPVTTAIVAQTATENSAFSLNASTHFKDSFTNATEVDFVYSLSANAPAWLTINSSTGVISGTPRDSDVTTTPVALTVTATDGSALSSITFNLTAVNEQNPVTAAIAAQTATENSLFSLDTSTHFSDSFTNAPEGDFVYSLTGAPAWLSINSSTGVISGTPREANITNTPSVLRVTATDGTNLASITFNLTAVLEENPATTAIVDQTATENAAFSLNASTHFSDSFTNVPEADFVYSLSGAPAWLTINPNTGVISGTPRDSDVTSTPAALTVKATDGVALSSITFNLTAVNEENPVTMAIAAQTATENSAFSLNASTHFSDSFTNVPEADFVYSLSSAPAWLTINAGTGVISGTPREGDITSFPGAITVTATDGSGQSSITFNLAVNEEAPVASTIADQTVTENSAFSLNVSTYFSDSFTNATEGDFSYRLSANAPAWLTINSRSGVISGTPREGDVTNTPVALTVTARDGVSVISSITFNLAVNEENPSLVGIPDQTAAENSAFSLDTSTNFRDSFTNVSEADFAYSLSGAPAWLTINPNTGVISGTPRDGDVTGTPVALTVTATDGSATASINFNLAAVNEENPVTSAIADQTATENAAFSLDASTHFSDSFTNAPEAAFVYNLSANAPAWLTINPNTGVISGTPGEGDITSTPVALTVTATDGAAISSINFNLAAVNEENPVTSAIADQTVTENVAFSLDASTHFSDSLTNAPEADFVYSLGANAPAWLSIDSTSGVVHGTPGHADVGASLVTVIASDSTAQSSVNINFNVQVNAAATASKNIGDPLTVMQPAPQGAYGNNAIALHEVSGPIERTALQGNHNYSLYEGIHTNTVFNGSNYNTEATARYGTFYLNTKTGEYYYQRNAIPAALGAKESFYVTFEKGNETIKTEFVFTNKASGPNVVVNATPGSNLQSPDEILSITKAMSGQVVVGAVLYLPDMGKQYKKGNYTTEYSDARFNANLVDLLKDFGVIKK